MEGFSLKYIVLKVDFVDLFFENLDWKVVWTCVCVHFSAWGSDGVDEYW